MVSKLMSSISQNLGSGQLSSTQWPLPAQCLVTCAMLGLKPRSPTCKVYTRVHWVHLWAHKTFNWFPINTWHTMLSPLHRSMRVYVIVLCAFRISFSFISFSLTCWHSGPDSNTSQIQNSSPQATALISSSVPTFFLPSFGLSTALQLLNLPGLNKHK